LDFQLGLLVDFEEHSDDPSQRVLLNHFQKDFW